MCVCVCAGLSGGRAMYHSEGPDLGHSRREPERVTPWCRHVVRWGMLGALDDFESLVHPS